MLNSWRPPANWPKSSARASGWLSLTPATAIVPLISPEKGAQGTHIILAIILLISGVYYPISVLPTWLQGAAIASPAYWALTAQRKALLEGAPLSQLGNEMAGLVATGAIFLPLGYLIFLLAEKYAKRTGLLKRSG